LNLLVERFAAEIAQTIYLFARRDGAADCYLETKTAGLANQLGRSISIAVSGKVGIGLSRRN
jgi:hypothetical protein